MGLISNGMYFINRNLETGYKLQQKIDDKKSNIKKAVQRLTAIPKAVLKAGVCTGLLTVARTVNVVSQALFLGISTVRMVCTLGLHQKSREDFVKGLAGTVLSVVQLGKKPFDAVAVILGGVVGVFSPKHQMKLEKAMCRLDAEMDELLADDGFVEKMNLECEASEELYDSEGFEALVAEHGSERKAINTSAFKEMKDAKKLEIEARKKTAGQEVLQEMMTRFTSATTGSFDYSPGLPPSNLQRRASL